MTKAAVKRAAAGREGRGDQAQAGRDPDERACPGQEGRREEGRGQEGASAVRQPPRARPAEPPCPDGRAARTGSSAPGRSRGPWSRGSAPPTRRRRSSCPRAARRSSAALAARFGNVRVAADNQAVVDAAPRAWCWPPGRTTRRAVLADLAFAPDAGRGERRRRALRRRLRAAVAPARGGPRDPAALGRRPAGPGPGLPAASRRPSRCSAGWATVVALDDETAFDSFSAASAFAATQLDLLATVEAWLVGRGVPAPDAGAYVRELIRGLSDALAEEPDRELALLAERPRDPGRAERAGPRRTSAPRGARGRRHRARRRRPPGGRAATATRRRRPRRTRQQDAARPGRSRPRAGGPDRLARVQSARTLQRRSRRYPGCRTRARAPGRCHLAPTPTTRTTPDQAPKPVPPRRAAHGRLVTRRRRRGAHPRSLRRRAARPANRCRLGVRRSATAFPARERLARSRPERQRSASVREGLAATGGLVGTSARRRPTPARRLGERHDVTRRLLGSVNLVLAVVGGFHARPRTAVPWSHRMRPTDLRPRPAPRPSTGRATPAATCCGRPASSPCPAAPCSRWPACGADGPGRASAGPHLRRPEQPRPPASSPAAPAARPPRRGRRPRARRRPASRRRAVRASRPPTSRSAAA